MAWLLTRIKSNNFYKHLLHTHQIRKISRVTPIRPTSSKDASFFNKLRNVFRQPDYEFSKTKLSTHTMPGVYSEQLGFPSPRLDYLDKAQVNLYIKRHMSGMTMRTPKPPIREPNMPQKGIKREDSSKKKEKKEKKKPVMYVQTNADEAAPQEAQPESPTLPPEFTRVYKNRWGVRLFEDQKPTIESIYSTTHQLVPVTNPIKTERRKPTASNQSRKIRLALVSGKEFEANRPPVRRPAQQQFHRRSAEQQQLLVEELNKIHDATQSEADAPPDVKAQGLLMAWQYAVVNSQPTKSSVAQNQLPSMLNNVEAVFIQPEAPGGKTDVLGSRRLKAKGSPSSQPTANYSTFTPVGSDTSPADGPTKSLSLPSVESFETRESEKESMKKFSNDLDSVLELECEKKKRKKEAKAQRKSEEEVEYDIRDSMKIRHDQKFEYGKYEDGVYRRLKMDSQKADTAELKKDKNIIVKIDGDPYPYSRDNFEKWRAPPYKPFNIHRIPVKSKQN